MAGLEKFVITEFDCIIIITVMPEFLLQTKKRYSKDSKANDRQIIIKFKGLRAFE
jgi:hypothetical protein